LPGFRSELVSAGTGERDEGGFLEQIRVAGHRASFVNEKGPNSLFGGRPFAGLVILAIGPRILVGVSAAGLSSPAIAVGFALYPLMSVETSPPD
jgi:hypothetical protein